MPQTRLSILDFMIETARDNQAQKQRGTCSTQLHDLVDIFSPANYAKQIEDGLDAKYWPAIRSIPITDKNTLQDRLVEKDIDPRVLAKDCELTPMQMASILRGDVSTEVDLWQLFAMADHMGLNLDLKIVPKEQEAASAPAPKQP